MSDNSGSKKRANTPSIDERPTKTHKAATIEHYMVTTNTNATMNGDKPNDLLTSTPPSPASAKEPDTSTSPQPTSDSIPSVNPSQPMPPKEAPETEFEFEFDYDDDEDDAEDVANLKIDIDATIKATKDTTLTLARVAQGGIQSLIELQDIVRTFKGHEYTYTNASESRYYIKFTDIESKENAEKLLIPVVPALKCMKPITETKHIERKLLIHINNDKVEIATALAAVVNWVNKVDNEADTSKLWLEVNKKGNVLTLNGTSEPVYNKLAKEPGVAINNTMYGVTPSTNGKFYLTGFNKDLKPSVETTQKVLKKLGLRPDGPITLNKGKITHAPRLSTSFSILLPKGDASIRTKFYKHVEQLEYKESSIETGETYTFKIERPYKTSF
jgi:hypothetical protein